jgi:glutathione S-transferase
MIDFFQITGSSSFAVRCALEEIGVEYRAIDIAPRERSRPPEFEQVNPWHRVSALRVVGARHGAVLLHDRVAAGRARQRPR